MTTPPVAPYDEWLEADGLGGFAMGTTRLVRERRYHALLCAATTPPTGRRVLVAGIDAALRTAAGTFALSAQHYAPDVLHPRGDLAIATFTPTPWPTWTFDLPGGVRVRHELFVPHGHAAVVLQWSLVAGGTTGAGRQLAHELTVRPFLSGRAHHALGGAEAEATAPRDGELVRLRLPAADVEVAAHGNGSWRDDARVYRDFLYAEERRRGYDAIEHLAAPGEFTFDLAHGPARLLFVAGDPPADLPGADPDAAIAAIAARESARRAAFASPLHHAAAAYVVARGTGRSVVAGYPWFTDWGRDTFLALRGLCLATGDLATARAVLGEWARHVSRGMLPNRFVDDGETVEYHTVDASLWFVVAAGELLDRTSLPADEHDRLATAIRAILAGYVAGTRHGIAMDRKDGLLRCGEPGRQLTWMDAIVGDRVVTPRIGKPVEVQALWHQALLVGRRFDARCGTIAARTRESFADRFWNEQRGCLHDVVDVDHAPGTFDPSLRANQVLALGGLPQALLSGERARMALHVVERELWTPLGLRTLAPDEPGYRPHCVGDPAERDLAYHNGTVWPWLAGPFVEAWLRVHGDGPARRAEARRRFVEPLLRHLGTAGLGHVSEIADGDWPHTPRGCPFQAWSLGELLRLELAVLADGHAKHPTPTASTSRA
jgi:predicted glycogen debranching enzyme